MRTFVGIPFKVVELVVHMSCGSQCVFAVVLVWLPCQA